jgi:hypothetical protein
MDKYNNDTHSSEPSQAEAPAHKQNLVAKLISNKIALSVGGLVLVAGIVALVVLLTNKNDTRQVQVNDNSQAQASDTKGLFMQQYGNGCQNREVAFSSAPMKLDELAFIRPLGAVSDGHVTPTDHVYIGGPNPNAADNTYAVLMPAEGTVTEVSAMPAQYIGDRTGQQVASEDHRLVISHSCRYFSIYIHIHKLSDKLKAAIGTLEPNQSVKTNVDFKAGDIVGYIGNSTFDWTPIDTSSTLKGFITPSLYQGEPWKMYTVSPFDLYSQPLKAQLEAKSLRTVAPIGGKIDYDQPGKLIGTWFRKDSGGYSGNNNDNAGRYWDGHLSVVPDYIDPASTLVSIGNWTGNAQQFTVSGTVDPAQVTSQSGMVKYELKRLNYVTSGNQAWNGNMPAKGIHPSQSETMQGTIAFEVMTGEKLKVEKFPGKTPAQVSGFTSGAQIYER